MKKIINNLELWNIVNELKNTFEKETELVLPAKVSYIIQYNIKILMDKYELIEKARFNIGKKYGTQVEEDSSVYQISKDKIELAQMELNQLMEIEQTVDILELHLKDLEECSLNMKQMHAILFMIKNIKGEEE